MRKIGLHIRLNQTICDAAHRAASLKTPIFQCFFIQQQTNQLITLDDDLVQIFLRDWRNKFESLYAHGSYWINLASAQSYNKIILREIEMAKKLAFTHIVVHPGATRTGTKKDGIAIIARNLNRILKTEHEIKIVLENAAHAGLSIGGDLQDFLTLKERLDHPEKVLFCIDTAHAFTYGYDVTTQKGQMHFLDVIDHTIGFGTIALIHLNDINQACGSRIDKHEKIGAGVLGGALRLFMMQEPLKTVPIILELPVMSEDEEEEIIKMVREWSLDESKNRRISNENSD